MPKGGLFSLPAWGWFDRGRGRPCDILNGVGGYVHATQVIATFPDAEATRRAYLQGLLDKLARDAADRVALCSSTKRPGDPVTRPLARRRPAPKERGLLYPEGQDTGVPGNRKERGAPGARVTELVRLWAGGAVA